MMPEVEFEWKIPKWSNAIERNRARTYFQAYAAAAALYFAEQAMEELHAGRTRTWTDFKVPDEAIGCGFHEAVRGVLSHHVVIRDGKIANYHPYPPTPWNASPRDIYGTPGPYEDAVQNTPIFEENGPDKFKGIDIMRAVRSFDPCLPCGVHMYLGDGKLLDVRHVPMFGVQQVSRGSRPRRGVTEAIDDGHARRPRVPGAAPAARRPAPRGRAARRPRGAGPHPARSCRPSSTCTAPGWSASSGTWTAAGEAGAAILDACARDDVVGGLLLLHGLHPLDLEARVRQALEQVRPYLRSHGGNVELLGVGDGVVRLRLEGSCHGCPSSAVTMKQTIEEAILAKAPDVTAVEVEGLT